MPRKYFVYLPFEVDTQDTRNLETAVEQWKTNVLGWKRPRDHLVNTVIPTLTKLSEDANVEKWQREEAATKLKQHAEDLKLLEKTLEKSPTLVRHLDSGEKLRQLSQYAPEKYVLYVAGHCAPGRESLTETQSIRTAEDPVSAKELVRRLVADGLPANVRNVKLLACFGGSANPHNGAQKAYAQQLWSELRRHCTGPVVLSAYTEAVLITSFYAGSRVGEATKTFGKVQLGSVLDMSTMVPGGQLKSVRVQFTSRPCQAGECTRPVLFRCTCGVELCVTCRETHSCA